MRPLRKILGWLYGKMRSAYYAERYDYFRKRYQIKSNFGFNGIDIRIYGEGQIELGQDSYIGNYSTMAVTKGRKIVIGNNCHISHNVRMYTSSNDPDQDFTKPKSKAPKAGDIIIGNGVWIGANVFINPGVVIGDNSVIGANSVVTKDVAENTIVGGVPAKLIRHKTYTQ
jgi:maltose O-acetyltransferase